MSMEDMHEQLKKANERRNCGVEAELDRLRAENERMREALEGIRPRVEAVHTALAAMPSCQELDCLYDESGGIFEVIAAALGEGGEEPETCVWRVEDGKRAVTSCYSTAYTWSQIATGPEICPDCGKRVEVRG